MGRTSKVGIDPAFQFGGSEQSISFDHILFAMHPFGLDRIEPRTLGWQQASKNADALATLLDLLVVGMKPGTDQLTAVPGGVVPDQYENPLARLGQVLAAPVQELRGHRAHRPVLHKAQPHLLCRRCGREVEAITGQGFGIGIIRRDRLFDQPQRLIGGTPGMQGGLAEPTPPGFIEKPDGPAPLLATQLNQAVARAFFRRYSGSGLVIQRLARFQRMPKRKSVARIVSPVTTCGLSPCS